MNKLVFLKTSTFLTLFTISLHELSHAMQDEHGIMARAIPFSGLRTTLFVVKGNKMSLEMAQLRMDHPCRQDGEKKFNHLKELLLNFFISELTE